MFHKEGSFTTGGGSGVTNKKKNTHDTPLRKSDRRKLRSRLLASFLVSSSSSSSSSSPPPPQPQDTNKETPSDNNDNNIIPPPPPPSAPLPTTTLLLPPLEKWLDEIFLNSSCEILLRKIKRPGAKSNAGNVTVYLRTPSPSSSSSSSVAGVGVEEYQWPYHETQPVVVVLPSPTNGSSNDQPILPTVALLSVLPPLLFSTTAAAETETDTDTSSSGPVTTHGETPPPNLLLPIRTVQIPPPVSKYLCRGADLMRSGILSCPSHPSLQPLSSSPLSFTPSAEPPQGWVAIRITTNPQPFAVGLLTEHTGQGEFGVGKRGVGVRVVTCYGDDLWSGQRRGAGGAGGGGGWDGDYGNVGFVEGRIVYGLKGVGEDIEEEEEEEDGSHDGVVNGKEPMGTKPSDQNPTTEPPPLTEDNHNTNNNDDDDEHSTSSSSSTTTTITPEETLLTAFHDSLLLINPKRDLPLPTSTYYTRFLLPSLRSLLPPNTQPSPSGGGGGGDTAAELIKTTQYRKIGTFLSSQASGGVITIQPSDDGRDPVAFLSGVDRRHIDLREARLRKKERGGEGKKESSCGTNQTAAQQQNQNRLVIANLHIIPHSIATLLHLSNDVVRATNAKSEERRGTGYLTGPECRTVLEEYIRSNNLINHDVDPENVKLDGPLCEGLYKKKLQMERRGILAKHGGGRGGGGGVGMMGVLDYPERVSRKELNEVWMEKMEEAYAIVRMPGSRILSMKRGRPPRVMVEVETRQNRKKFLTRVRGLEEYNIDAAKFANDASKRFACSSSLDDDPAGRAALKKGRVEIVFQGNLGSEMEALLTGNERLSSHGGVKGGEYRLPKGAVEVILGKGCQRRR